MTSADAPFAFVAYQTHMVVLNIFGQKIMNHQFNIEIVSVNPNVDQHIIEVSKAKPFRT